MDPDGSDKRYLLGADYFAKGLVAPALEELLKAVELNPQNADAHNLLGIVHLRKAADGEELATRAQCLKGEALKLEKDEIDGHFRKAETEFKRAVEVIETLPAGALLLGDRLYCSIEIFLCLKEQQAFGLVRYNKTIKYRKLKRLSRKNIDGGILEDFVVTIGAASRRHRSCSSGSCSSCSGGSRSR